MSTIRTITKTIVTRAWHDIEPKLIAWLATGLTATGLIAAADYIGVPLTATQAGLIVLVVGTIAGYIKSSTSKVLSSPTSLPPLPAPVLAAPPTSGPLGVATIAPQYTDAPAADQPPALDL